MRDYHLSMTGAERDFHGFAHRLAARETAEKLGVPHVRSRVVGGAGMDHGPLAARGLTALSILGDVVRASLALHPARDDMRLIDRAALARAGRLAAHLAWRWAELHA
jgi:hypothetical protein